MSADHEINAWCSSHISPGYRINDVPAIYVLRRDYEMSRCYSSYLSSSEDDKVNSPDRMHNVQRVTAPA